MIELTNKIYEKQRKKGIKSNEGYVYQKKNDRKKIIKVFETNSLEYLKMKQYTLGLLLENKLELQNLKIAIPEDGVKIDGVLRGYQAKYIKGSPLSYVLYDTGVSLDMKISCLKQVGLLLREMEQIRNSNSNLGNLFYNDIHEKNFLVTSNNEVMGIDFDSCSILDNTPVQGLYSMMLRENQINNSKYRQCARVCDDSTEYVVDKNLDLYCYMMMVLNFMYGVPMYMWNSRKLNKYLDYLESINTNKELLYALSRIYDDRDDNVNIDFLLAYIKEVYPLCDCTKYNATNDMKKILMMKSDWV